ncbi:V-type proton ATPase subunit e 2-like isoform X1 [Eurytemora carolleeae]|uniref:V-type proton ATPase subunit e 2-like isoform X1 n=1 Tax=Eurytemora carolleeae TaxID=1294199 RepID=UPI000C7591BE|nr:V-type proton ATPase subunit e 2-like isoform X1 [Eurytemora carolleeae]|eukprot:XP_023342599.1 V-type proton ATPase subunit e 2-like isoform X1 [Eurytemora affinis]
MVAHWLPVLMFTLIWGLVGGVAPKFVPRGPHQSLIQMSLLLTGICCWLFWLCCYMSQMNPLIENEDFTYPYWTRLRPSWSQGPWNHQVPSISYGAESIRRSYFIRGSEHIVENQEIHSDSSSSFYYRLSHLRRI